MRTWIFDHALLPEGWTHDVAITVADGVIVEVVAGARGLEGNRQAGIAIPGLPNVHSHTFQRAMAGLAECRGASEDGFWVWREVMYRFLRRLAPEAVEAIAAFAFMEMLESGFTAVGEFHYLHHDIDGRPYGDLAEMSGRIAAAAAETGIGLTLLPVYYADGGFGGRPPDAGQQRFLNDVDRFAGLLERAREVVSGLPDAVVGVAPHSLRAAAPRALTEVVGLAGDGPIHIHAAEQMREVEECVAWSGGRRPVEWLLDEAGVDGRWCLVHATHMSGEEVHRLAASGAVAGLCPLTEANLGDGLFPAVPYLEAGGSFAVGSDSNVAIGAAAELMQLEYGQRLELRTRNVFARRVGESTGRQLYEKALAGGCQALGRRIGALAVGWRADIVVLNAAHPDLCTVEADHWLDRYVFTAGGSAVETVLVGGAPLVVAGHHRGRERIIRKYVDTLNYLNAS